MDYNEQHILLLLLQGQWVIKDSSKLSHETDYNSTSLNKFMIYTAAQFGGISSTLLCLQEVAPLSMIYIAPNWILQNQSKRGNNLYYTFMQGLKRFLNDKFII